MPRFVASSRYTDPMSTMTPTAKVRKPRSCGSQAIPARVWTSIAQGSWVVVVPPAAAAAVVEVVDELVDSSATAAAQPSTDSPLRDAS